MPSFTLVLCKRVVIYVQELNVCETVLSSFLFLIIL